MGTFLLLLVLFFLVVPLIKSMAAIYRARKAARRFFEQFRQDPASSSSQNRGSYRPEPQRPRKKINPDDGEFVQFEDLPADSGSDRTTVSETIVEQQVVDVEWEDIK